MVTFPSIHKKSVLLYMTKRAVTFIVSVTFGRRDVKIVTL